MIEFYPQIKQAHIGLALLSGGLFALRGLLLLAGMQWPNAAPVRNLSYSIDTALLVAYVVLGVFALRRGRTRRARGLLRRRAAGVRADLLHRPHAPSAGGAVPAHVARGRVA